MKRTTLTMLIAALMLGSGGFFVAGVSAQTNVSATTGVFDTGVTPAVRPLSGLRKCPTCAIHVMDEPSVGVNGWEYAGPPQPGTGQSSLGGHGDISIPVDASTLLGYEAFTYWVNVTWDFDGYTVKNVVVNTYYWGVNASFVVQNDLELTNTCSNGCTSSFIRAQGSITNVAGFSFIGTVGFNWNFYPMVEVTVFNDGSYALGTVGY